jgi:hypothetical protein
MDKVYLVNSMLFILWACVLVMVSLWCSLIQCSKVHETIEILGSFNIDTWLWFWICFLPAQYAVSSTFFRVSYSKLVFLLFLQVAPYERPALSKAYLFPEGNLVNTTNNFFWMQGYFVVLFFDRILLTSNLVSFPFLLKTALFTMKTCFM